MYHPNGMLLTQELARMLEDLVAPDESPGGADQPEVRRFGGTYASRAKGGRPSNKVFLFSEADLGHLDAILDFYESENLEPTFYLSPMRFTRAVGQALAKAGFCQQEFEQAIFYREVGGTSYAIPAEVSIERVSKSNAEEYVQTMAAGFEWPEEWRDFAIKGTLRELNFDSLNFLARWNGEPAAVASLGQRRGIASFAGGAVIPSFRCRGIHRALIEYRLRLPEALSAKFLTGGANYGTPSFRNQLRAGFKLAYVESAWARS